jgi:hypothetical protein
MFYESFIEHQLCGLEYEGYGLIDTISQANIDFIHKYPYNILVCLSQIKVQPS